MSRRRSISAGVPVPALDVDPRETDSGSRRLCLQDPANGGDVPLPLGLLGLELPPSLSRERVVLGPPVVLRDAPLGLNETPGIEAVQGRIDGALLHEERLLGDSPEPLHDLMPVLRLGAHSLHQQEPEGTAQEVQAVGAHGLLP